MTAIKQASVMSGEHLQNLKRYFDWDREKVLDHDTQHIIDEDRWFEEMDNSHISVIEELHDNIVYIGLDNDFYSTYQEILKKIPLQKILENGILVSMDNA